MPSSPLLTRATGRSRQMPAYAELHCHSYYSLLDAASAPEALVARAQELGLCALALTDHDSLAGAIRFWTAARQAGLHPIIGAEVTLDDKSHLTLLAATQQGYANLCHLITASRLASLPDNYHEIDAGAPTEGWPGKPEPFLPWSTLAEHCHGLLALTGCRRGALPAALLADNDSAAHRAIRRILAIFGTKNTYVELQHHYLPDDVRLLHRLCTIAGGYDLPVVATNNVHYALPQGSLLRDALIAIRYNQSLAEVRRAGLLPLNSSYALLSPTTMAKRFANLPTALTTTLDIAERCQVSLDFSGWRLPNFATPDGQDEFGYLYQLCHANLAQRYPRLKPAVLKQLAHELDVIEQAGLAGYFLIVWDIVNFARTHQIRCQGRGSAANSIVAYLLGITSIDPQQHNLLFERFLSPDKFTTPDIDIDFAADRREEVIQYVYRKYGEAHTAMVCNVITYRARSALRDLGKALDFPVDVVERLIKSLDTYSPTVAADQIHTQIEQPIEQAANSAEPSPGIPPFADNEALGSPPSSTLATSGSHPLVLLAQLLRQIDGCPRHLSIHSGGMLITGPPLQEIVPLEPATMPGRVVCQWDKDSVEDAGLIKIDLLGLRTLGLLEEALTHIAATGSDIPDVDRIPLDDPVLYRMLQRADTIGTFQVESRAQQQMLPRLKPERFEDIIVEVAIVRPGPIQGGAVHPYLRRRAGDEAITYIHPCLKPVLQETLGVLLFQEQAIRVAMAAAGFSPGEADMLRRALSRSDSDDAMVLLCQRFVQGAHEQGIDQEMAQAIFSQLAGFAGYGFCKSHAASFALIAYQTLYLKQYHPAAFYCALFNQQPMGFYSTEVIAGDARRHGIALLPPSVNHSDWRYTIEHTRKHSDAKDQPKLRTGLSAVTGLGEHGWQRIESARCKGVFQDLTDFCRRTRLPQDAVTALIRAGTLDEFGQRRQLLWHLGNLNYQSEDAFFLTTPLEPISLPPLSTLEETAWEYELLGLAPDVQIMAHYRQKLRAQFKEWGIYRTWQVKRQTRQFPNGRRVRVAGMVVVRQRPSTAKGITFLSMEDESGLLDLVIKPQTYPHVRSVLHDAPLIVAEGIVQRANDAVSVLVHAVYPIR